MPVPQVKIVNANGRVGYVPATYPPLVRGHLKRAPSERNQSRPDPTPDGAPARNASTDTWRDYATEQGMSAEEASYMTRDELVAHFQEEATDAEDAL